MNEHFSKSFMTAVAYLPDKVWRACYSLSASQREACEEIRLRLGRPPKALVHGKFIILTDKGISTNVTADDINYVLNKATKSSLHSYSEQIKRGYITTDEGHRVGLSGELVTDNDAVATIKNTSSINLRIAKPCYNSAENILTFYLNNCITNTLIISEAGDGKTSLLRELSRRLSVYYSITIMDERYEIAGLRKDSKYLFDIGDCDVISGGTKSETFNIAIKNMSPKIIIADEITSEEDAEIIRRIAYCGSKIIASAHCSDINELNKRPIYRELMECNTFDTVIQIGRADENRIYKIFTSEVFNDFKDSGHDFGSFVMLGNRPFYEQKM